MSSQSFASTSTSRPTPKPRFGPEAQARRRAEAIARGEEVPDADAVESTASAARGTSAIEATNASESAFAAREAPRTFEDFVRQINDLSGSPAARTGQLIEDEAVPGLTIDADLFESIFGDGSVDGEGSIEGFMGSRSRGASQEFIEKLPKVTDKDLNAEEETPYSASCPVCLSTYAQILTEQEYAEHSDFHIGKVEEMGLRRLPCRHIICGRCAGKWMRVNNTCPLCRSTLDPSILPANPLLDDPAIANPIAAETQTSRLLELFRAVFAREQGPGPNQDAKEATSNEYSSMYS